MAAGLLAAGLQVGGLILDEFGRPKFKGTDPTDFKDDLTLSDADIAKEISMIQNKAQDAAGLNIANIKQMGAANRLPKGAVASNIAEVSGKVGEVGAKVLPGLKREQRAGITNFLNLKNRFDQNKLGYEQNINDRRQGGFGSLAQTALLWNSGLLK